MLTIGREFFLYIHNPETNGTMEYVTATLANATLCFILGPLVVVCYEPLTTALFCVYLWLCHAALCIASWVVRLELVLRYACFTLSDHTKVAWLRTKAWYHGLDDYIDLQFVPTHIAIPLHDMLLPNYRIYTVGNLPRVYYCDMQETAINLNTSTIKQAAIEYNPQPSDTVVQALMQLEHFGQEIDVTEELLGLMGPYNLHAEACLVSEYNRTIPMLLLIHGLWLRNHKYTSSAKARETGKESWLRVWFADGSYVTADADYETGINSLRALLEPSNR